MKASGRLKLAVPFSPRSTFSSSSLLLSSLELSDVKVYEPQIRALLGTASHFCEVVGRTIGVVSTSVKVSGRLKLAVPSTTGVPRS